MVDRKGMLLMGGIAGVIAVVVFIAYLGTAGQTRTSPGDLPNPYVSRAYAFSVQYPQGWKGYENYKIDANTTSVVSFVGANSSISVIAYPVSPSQTLDSIESASKQTTIKRNDFTMTLQEQGQGVVSRVPAHVQIWLADTPQGKYQEQTVHMIYHGRLYAISFVAPAKRYNEELVGFDQFLRTFTFS